MKKVLLIVSFLVAIPSSVIFAQSYSSESQFNVVNSTITLSSSTAYGFSSDFMWYRELEVGDPAIPCNIYYRCDGSSVSVPTVGMWISTGTAKTIYPNGTVYMQLPAGQASQTVRVEKRKR